MRAKLGQYQGILNKYNYIINIILKALDGYKHGKGKINKQLAEQIMVWVRTSLVQLIKCIVIDAD